MDITESAGPVVYSHCTFADECPRYDIKQSDGDIPVMQEFGQCGVPL